MCGNSATRRTSRLSLDTAVHKLQALPCMGVAMGSCLLALALLLLPASASAGVKETIAALAPSAIVLVVDAKGNELVAQNSDEPFTPASVTKIVTDRKSTRLNSSHRR